MNEFDLLDIEDPITYITEFLSCPPRKITSHHIQIIQATAKGVYEDIMPDELQARARTLLFKAPHIDKADEFGYLHLISLKNSTYPIIISTRYLYRDVIKAHIEDFSMQPNEYVVIHCLWDFLPDNFNSDDLIRCEAINLMEKQYE